MTSLGTGSYVIKYGGRKSRGWGGEKPQTGKGKGIAGSSNMADGSHVVGNEKTQTRRKKGIAGSDQTRDAILKK